MGITGLLPFLEKASKRTNISEFAGGTVAIDSYCWLHRGVFSCAEKIVMGHSTDAYVRYCMKFIYMLLSHKIKPILVFDGRHLPAKAQTEEKRREARDTNRRKAIELMRMGQNAEARNLIRRSIDITHEMALELIKECQKMNIDCIVAPYEADAQLAYLNISGIADVVITEDSDLTLFGCKKVFFKLDINGNGVLVSQEQLYLAMDTRSDHFSMDDFLYMCILSGCDYLPSLPGIGLGKAKKFIKTNTDCDIHRALTRLGSYLNMKSLVVTQEYRDSFILAVITFKHQLVFCPLKRKQVRLNPPMSDVTEEQLHYAGTETNPDIALELAFGNRDPFTSEVLHNFNPDKMENHINKGNTWGHETKPSRSISIWSKDYKLVQNQFQESPQKLNRMIQSGTPRQKTAMSKGPMNMYTKRLKRARLEKQQDNSEGDQLNQREMLDIYESKNTMDVENNSEENNLTPDEDLLSPILTRRTNPFSSQSSSTKTSPSLLLSSRSRTRGRHMMRIRRTIINEETVTQSKFFTKVTAETNDIATDDNRTYSPAKLNEILLEKENMQLEKLNETSNINLQVLMVTDKDKMDSYPMDIDEEYNASFASNECKNVRDTEKANVNELHNLNTFTSSELNVDADFLIQQGEVGILNNSFFNWSDTKVPTQSNKVKQKRSSLSSRTNVNSKINTTNGTRRSQRMCSVQGQQSLLSKFGFEKRKLA